MNKYEKPEIKVQELEDVDVISTSGGGGLVNGGSGSSETDEPMEWGLRKSLFN